MAADPNGRDASDGMGCALAAAVAVLMVLLLKAVRRGR